MTTTTSTQQHLTDLYQAFNIQDIESVLNAMEEEVQWANGLEGGFVHGRDKVREYWLKQFQQIHPQLEILSFEQDDRDRAIVIVRQIVHDLEGNLLSDQTTGHRFTVKGNLIALFEIIDPDPKPTHLIAE